MLKSLDVISTIPTTEKNWHQKTITYMATSNQTTITLAQTTDNHGYGNVYSGMAHRSSCLPPVSKTLTIKGTDTCVDTGIDVKPGDRVVITATGKWKNDGKPETYEVTADGFSTYKNPDAIMPDTNFASLIGRFGESGEPFFVGSHYDTDDKGTTDSGRLCLQMNDVEGYFYDNVGELEVMIEVKR